LESGNEIFYFNLWNRFQRIPEIFPGGGWGGIFPENSRGFSPSPGEYEMAFVTYEMAFVKYEMAFVK